MIDRVVMTVFPAPGSYTGEDLVEIHCHAGNVTPRLILRTLIENGCRPAEPGEFTLRACLSGKLDLIQAEAVLDVIESTTEAAQQGAVHGMEGSLSREIGGLREEVTELSARVEYFIDFPEEDDVLAGPAADGDRARDIVRRIDHLLRTAADGRKLAEGVLTVIAGVPNVGKSTLFNLLLEEERAIVTPLPGTTRDAIEASIEAGGLPLRLVDTAGIRSPGDPIEEKGVTFSRRYLEKADLILFVTEANRTMTREERLFVEEFGVKTVVVRNKLDLGNAGEADRLPPARRLLEMSCRTRKGLEELRSELAGSAGRLLRLEEEDGGTIVLRARHREGLGEAKKALETFVDSCGELPPEILAIELARSRAALEGLIGAITEEDLLDRIFANFCVGK